MGGICVQEWGNPVANKSTYDLMLSYSPVDNVKEQAYPSMLVIGGLSSCHIAVICGKLQMICTQSSMTSAADHLQAGCHYSHINNLLCIRFRRYIHLCFYVHTLNNSLQCAC